jgi:glycosyltransferase involved in cell wall biosynthesis
MKIVFVSLWYSENMGYIENALPPELALLGHEVHLVTSTANVYYNHPYWKNTYGKYLTEPIVKAGVYESNGVTIHRLPFHKFTGKIQIEGLTNKIKELNPDIVHTFEHQSLDTVRLALLKRKSSFKLFTANHNAMLTLFPPQNSLLKNQLEKLKLWALYGIKGWFVSKYIECCFCVTSDAAEVAHKYYFIPKKKLKVTTLGTNTRVFRPNKEAREKLRKKWGYTEGDVICIFTGKFSEVLKNPLILAKATEILIRKGLKIKSLFIGDGDQAEALAACEGCQVLPFMAHEELPHHYAMADIAVWPFAESNSQLDAAASGNCLILCDGVQAYDLVEAETKFSETTSYKPKIVSRFYQFPNVDDLVKVLEPLVRDENLRADLSLKSYTEMVDIFSWEAIAKRRVLDYQRALGGG